MAENRHGACHCFEQSRSDERYHEKYKGFTCSHFQSVNKGWRTVVDPMIRPSILSLPMQGEEGGANCPLVSFDRDMGSVRES